MASSVEAIVRPTRTALNQMRDCIRASARSGPGQEFERRNPSLPLAPEEETEGSFSFRGFYSEKGWDQTKEENEIDSRCLSSVWDQSVSGTTVLQMFLGSSGYIRGSFANSTLNSEISFEGSTADARTSPDFVFSTTFQKEIIIILDFSGVSAEFLPAMKSGANAVILGLSDLDYAQVTTSVPGFDKGFDCGTGGLIRATESNKKLLMEYVDTLSPGSNDSSHLTPLQLFDNAFNLTSVAGTSSSCQPLYFYVSPNQITKSDVNSITKTNNEYGVRIFTFAIQSAMNPEGYLGGGMIYDLACENDGSWYNIQTPSDVPNKMIQYQMILQRSRTITAPSWRVSFSTFGDLSGLLIGGSLPVFSASDNKTLIGVVVVQFNFNDIQDYVDSLARGLSFAFLMTWNGDLLIHPSYRDPKVVKDLPLYYDVSNVENSENFINSVRGPLVSERSGEMTVIVDRPLPKGDTGTVGFSTLPVNTSFFWSQLQSLPFTIVLAYSIAELRAPVFIANNRSDWVTTTRISVLLDQPDLYDYVPLDYTDSLIYDGLDIFSTKYACAMDCYRNFDQNLAEEALSKLDDKDLYTSDNIMEQPDTARAIQTFFNNLYTPFIHNPGFEAQFREATRFGSQFFRLWAQDASEQVNDDTSFRYAGFYTQNTVTYVALVNHSLSHYPYFLSRNRPWYQKAESNPRVACVATPYLDAAFQGKVTTVSKAIFDNPELSLEENLIVSVVGVDKPYANFHQDFVDSTGCAYDRKEAMATGLPMCYLMDNSGLLVVSPDFLTPTFNTYDRTNSDNLPVGLAEPWLALDLIDKKVLIQSSILNFRGSVTELVYDEDGNVNDTIITPIDAPQEVSQYSVNSTVIDEAGGAITGILEKVDGYCTSGTYILTKVEGTNTFLIYIENYSIDNSPDCRVFELQEVKLVAFGTCEENAKNYPQFSPLCPHSDSRESTTESNRPDDALCDLEPPKEADFVAWEDPAAIAMISVASVLIGLTLVLWVIVHKYRHTPVILMSSPVFVYLQFFGFVLGYTNIYLWTGEPTAAQCGLRPWIASIAFVFIVGPMFAKTYRIWKLFSGKGFYAKRISDTAVFFYVGAMLVIPLAICIIWSAYEIPEPTFNDDHFDNDKRTYRCDGDSCRIFEGIMIGYCGCLLVLGTFFAFHARKASSHFNEARFIGLSIYMITFCGIVGVTLTYVLLGLPIAYYLVFCVTVMLGILFTTLIVYYPKIRICLFKPAKNIYVPSSTLASKTRPSEDS